MADHTDYQVGKELKRGASNTIDSGHSLPPDAAGIPGYHAHGGPDHVANADDPNEALDFATQNELNTAAAQLRELEMQGRPAQGISSGDASSAALSRKSQLDQALKVRDAATQAVAAADGQKIQETLGGAALAFGTGAAALGGGAEGGMMAALSQAFAAGAGEKLKRNGVDYDKHPLPLQAKQDLSYNGTYIPVAANVPPAAHYNQNDLHQKGALPTGGMVKIDKGPGQYNLSYS